MLTVIMLTVIMLSVVAPTNEASSFNKEILFYCPETNNIKIYGVTTFCMLILRIMTLTKMC